MKSNEEKLRELRWELFKLKGKDMYTRIYCLSIYSIITKKHCFPPNSFVIYLCYSYFTNHNILILFHSLL